MPWQDAQKLRYGWAERVVMIVALAAVTETFYEIGTPVDLGAFGGIWLELAGFEWRQRTEERTLTGYLARSGVLYENAGT